MTSDRKFVINIDKIAFIDANIYGDDYVYDSKNVAYYFNTSINHNLSGAINEKLTNDITNTAYLFYDTPNKVTGSFFYVYIEGCESPLKLIYGDGIQLINFITSNSGGGIFYNTYSANLIETSAYFQKSIDAKYKCSYSYVPNLVNHLFVTDLNNIGFNGDNKNSYMPYSTQIFLTDRTI